MVWLAKRLEWRPNSLYGAAEQEMARAGVGALESDPPSFKGCVADCGRGMLVQCAFSRQCSAHREFLDEILADLGDDESDTESET